MEKVKIYCPRCKRKVANWDGKSKINVKTKDNIDFNSPNENKYNIESIEKFRGRIKSFFDEVTSDYKGKNILVVTHAGVGIYARCYFEGEPINKDYSKYKIKNCKIIKYNND